MPDGEVNTTNDMAVCSVLGPSSSVGSMFVNPRVVTKQQAYRFAAWTVVLAELLPDEDPPSTFEEVMKAIRNT